MSNESNRRSLFPARPSLEWNVLWIASVAILYFAFARLSLSLSFEPAGIAAIWPPTGIFLSAILLTRRDLRPWLVGTLFITDFISEMLTGTPWLVSFIYALVLTGDAVLSTWLLLRLVGEPITFRRVRDLVGWLLLSVVLSNALSSLAAASAASGLLPGTSFWGSWIEWGASAGIGNLLVTPLILSWAEWARTRPGVRNQKRVLEGAILFTLMAVLTYIAFDFLSEYGLFSIFLTYLIFPFLVWAAWRFGMRGVTSVLVILAAIAIYFASTGRAANLILQGSALDVVIAIQLYLVIIAVPGLFLAVVMTERHVAEQALSESEDKFKYVFDHSPIGKSITLASGEIHVNQVFSEMLGYSPEELQSKRWQDITHPDDIDLTQREMNVLLSGEKDTARFAKRFFKKDGSILWVDVSSSLRRDAAGKPVYFMTALVDITERMQAEDVLRKNEAQLRAILDATPFPIALVDEQANNIEFWSRSALTLFGHTEPTATEWYQKAYPDADYRQEVIDRWNAHLEKARRSDQAVNTGVYRITCRDGSMRICELYARFLADRLIVTFNDITDRKQAEQVLHENEQRLSSIYATVGDVIYYLSVEPDEQYRFISVNLAFLKVTGLPSEQVIGRKVNEIIPEPSLTIVLGKYRQAIEEKAIVRWEETSDYPTGRLTGEVNIAPVFDEAGACTHLVGSVHDITERKLMEEALRASEERFKAIASNTPDHILMQDHQLKYTFVVNPQLGLTEQDMIGKTDDDFLSKEDATQLTQIKTRVLENGKPEHLETSLISMAGNEEHFEGVYIPKFDNQGQVDGLIGYFRNITDRKQAEQALRESEEQYRTLFHNNHTVMLIIDPENGAIVDANPAAASFYGWTAEELSHKNIREINLLSEEETKKEMQLARTKQRNYFLFQHRKKNGQVRDIEVYSSPIQLKGEVYLYSIIHDITERKQAEAKSADQLDELHRWYEATLGREMRVLELKEEVNELLVQAGFPPKYDSTKAGSVHG
jgi:PAS domain S-box-containing protein